MFANICSDLLPRSLDITEGLPKDETISADISRDSLEELAHIPLSLRILMRHDIVLIKGYSGLFRFIITYLRSGSWPSLHAIGNSITKGSAEEYFFQRGGKPEYALKYLLDISEQVDGVRARNSLEDVLFGTEWLSLPRCRNDCQYALLKRVLLGDS